MPSTAVTTARGFLNSAKVLVAAETVVRLGAVDAAAGQPPAVIAPLKLDLQLSQSAETAATRAHRHSLTLT